MFFYVRRQIARAPLYVVALLLFALICTAVIGELHTKQLELIQNQKQLHDSIPVKLTVTNLQGTQAKDLQAPDWVVDVFTGEGNLRKNLSQYVTNLQMQSSVALYAIDEPLPQLPQESLPEEQQEPQLLNGANLVGINVLQAADVMLPERNTTATWFEGFDEAVLQTPQWVCLAPATFGFEPGQKIVLIARTTQYKQINGEWTAICEDFRFTFTVAGVYSGSDMADFFCPFGLLETVYDTIKRAYTIDSISATLIDNDLLEQLRQDRGQWFAEPTPIGSKTPWDYMDYEYYPYALDIDDTILLRTMKTLDSSISINRLSGYALLAVASIAAYLISLLVVRQQKRVIIMMSTIGVTKWTIGLGIAIEQLIGVASGVILSAARYQWQPWKQYCSFFLLYLLGMTVALVVFLRTNLLSSMKEEE